MLLITYEEFLHRVDELGFMALSDFLAGFPSVSEETLEENWHTGDPDTDPWCWKQRAATEKPKSFRTGEDSWHVGLSWALAMTDRT